MVALLVELLHLIPNQSLQLGTHSFFCLLVATGPSQALLLSLVASGCVERTLGESKLQNLVLNYGKIMASVTEHWCSAYLFWDNKKPRAFV